MTQDEDEADIYDKSNIVCYWGTTEAFYEHMSLDELTTWPTYTQWTADCVFFCRMVQLELWSTNPR